MPKKQDSLAIIASVPLLGALAILVVGPRRMSADGWTLVAFVVLFWVAFAIPIRHKSLFPIIPLYPMLALVVGFLVNAWIHWAGTIVVVVLQILPFVLVAIGYCVRARRESGKCDKEL